MLPAPRFACLAAAVGGPAAAVAGAALDSALPGLAAGAAALLAGVLGWRASTPLPGRASAGPGDGRGPAPLSAGAGAGAAGGSAPLDDPTQVPLGAPSRAPLVGAVRAPGEASLDDPVDEFQTLVDAESGLFAQGYLLVALEARIAAARRRLRPVSIVMVDVVEGLRLGQPVVGDPAAVSAAIRATLREADTAGRLMDGRYVLVLEDTNETGAVWTVERVRAKLGRARPGCTVWAGVACYPAHGFTLPEILSGADSALVLAREWRQDRIEVAASE